MLLILAGVTIAALSGNNGILQNATKAKEESEQSSDIEKIKIAISEAQMTDDGYQVLSTDNLGYELIKDGINAIVSDNEDGTKHILFLDEKKEYSLDNNGNIEDLNIDFDTKYVAPSSQDEERNEGVIGIGTDGKPVDMDLWEYTLLEDGTYDLCNKDDKSGYIGDLNDNGEIEGNIPQYISSDKGQSYNKVTNLTRTFKNLTGLKKFPTIPSTVTTLKDTFNKCNNLIEISNLSNSITNMWGTFNGCTSIKKIDYLPENLSNMGYCFQNCTSLVEVCDIPDKVNNMEGTFFGCTNLKYIPKLPRDLINMQAIFSGCINLISEDIEIPENVTNMRNAFTNCKNLKYSPKIIPNKVEDMYCTFMGCSNLETVPTIIPEKVTNIESLFNSCTKISGTIVINAQISDFNNYRWCFLKAATQNGCKIIIKGNSNVLQGIFDTALNNPNIILENK